MERAPVTNRLQTVRFELDVAAADAAPALQDRVSGFCRARLPALLDDCLAAFADADTVLRCERLELDLGPIAPGALEDELAYRLTRALREALARQLATVLPVAPRAPAAASRDAAASRLEAVARCLERGVLPSGGRSGSAAALDDALLAALREEPARTLSLLRTVGRKAAARRRLAQQCSEPVLHALAHLLAPAHAPFVIDFAKELAKLHALRPLVERDGAAFGPLLWESILSHLLLASITRFDAVAFIGDTVRGLCAGREAIATALLARVVAELRTLSHPFCTHYALANVLELVRTQPHARSAVAAQGEPAASAPPAAAAMALSRQRLQLVAAFLQRGVLSWSAGEIEANGIGRTLDALMAEVPDELLALLRRLGQQDAVRLRLAAQLQDPTIERLVHLLEPRHARVVLLHVREMRRIQRQRAPVPAGDRAFGAALWQFVLTYLLVERGSQFNRREFVKSTLAQMAARYRMRYGELVMRLIAAVRVTSARVAAIDPLGRLLLSLSDELFAGAAPPRADAPAPLFGAAAPRRSNGAATPAALDPERRPAHERGDRDALVRLLAHGVWPASSSMPGTTLAQWLRGIADADLDAALRRTRRLPQVARRIVRQLPATLFPRVVQILAGADAGPVLAFDADLRGATTQGALGATGDDRIAAQAREYLLARLLADADQPLALPELVRSVLAAIAVRHNAGYRRLLDTLGAQARDPVLRSLYAAQARSLDVASRAQVADAARASAPPIASDPVEAVIAFLRTGRVPSATHAAMAMASPGWFATVLEDHAERLVPALKGVADRPDVLRRLWRHVPPAVLEQVVAALVPAHAALVSSYLQFGTRVQAELPLSSGQRRQAAAIHWQVVLTLLLDPHAPSFSPQAFVAHANQRIAQRLGLTATAYATRLRAAARTAADRSPASAALSAVLDTVDGAASAPVAAAAARTARAQSAASTSAPPAAATAAAQPQPPDLLAALRAFLRFGSLPAQADGDTLEALAGDLAQAFAAQPAAFRRLALGACGRELERLRIARAFPPPLLAALLRLLLPSGHRAAAFAVEVLGAALTALVPGSNARDVRAAVTCDLLHVVHARRTPRFDATHLLERSARRVEPEHGIAPLALLARVGALAAASTSPQRSTLQRAVERLQPAFDLPPVAPDPAPESAPASRWRYRRDEAAADPLPAGEAFYVANAGLVLLWPFLPRYFELLGLLDQQAFRDETSRSRAVFLLQHLATGTVDALEPALLLNKILCGMPCADPPDPAPALTAQERQTSEEVLYAVTQNWSKLRNTSVAGLRDSFLIRAGRLQRKDEGWALTVEARAYDVLLDTLPWRISTIRLPWMQGVLYVSWR